MSVYSVLDALDEETATTCVDHSGDLKVEIADRLALVVTLVIGGRLRVAEERSRRWARKLFGPLPDQSRRFRDGRP